MSDEPPPAPAPPPSAVPPPGQPHRGGVPPAGVPGIPNSGLAIASLVLGIVSFLCCTGIVTAIPGVITGHMARSEIRTAGGRLGGDGMALTGIILGYLMIAATIIGTLLLFAFGLFTTRIASQIPTAT